MSNTDTDPAAATSTTTNTTVSASSTEPSSQTGGPVVSDDVARTGAQSADPYRATETNDYSVSLTEGDSSEATVSNLFQQVPLDDEGGEVIQAEEAGSEAQAAPAGDATLDGSADVSGGGTGDGPAPLELNGGIEATAADAGDATAGVGLNAAPEGDGLPQFDLGGDGASAEGVEAGPGAGGGGVPDGDPAVNSVIGDVVDVDDTANAFSEDAPAGTVVGLTALAVDPDGDTVIYTIDDPRFAIDPTTGLVTIAEGAEFDAETEGSVSVIVTATSSDGSSSSQTFVFTVGDADEADVGPVSDTDASANSFAEDAAAGSATGLTAFADDPDISDSVTYAIDDPRFDIDPTTGVVTVAEGAVFDAETEGSITVVVTATSTDGSQSTETFVFTVTDVDEFDVGPVSDVDGTENTVAENSAGGTVVGITAFAEDADATDTVTYSITDTRFVIDPNTGVVTVADGAVLDAETTSSIDLVVTATSTDGSTSQATFTITISDENEFAIGPVSDVDGTENTVAENSAGGTVVGITAFAEDADATDTVTYSITDTRFVIDPTTGVVTVADGAVLDAETTSSIDLVVTATSTDGSTSQATFTITISDENEFAIGPVTDVDGTENTVAENSAGGTVVGITAFAEDADATDTVTYSITDTRFVIDPTTGVVTVADGAVLDAETTSSIDLVVTATSTDGSTSQATFTITISDENEFAIGPVTDVDGTENTVAENSAGGTVVGITAFAEDADATDTVTYSITDTRFVIDPTTGVVTVADGAVLDAETTSSIDLVVTATSTDGSTSQATFTITISDENEFAIGPVSDVDGTENTVAENSAGGTVVGITAFAEDADATDTVTYSITDTRFVIDPTTGVVTVADGAVLDAETTSSIDLVVTATSTDGSTSQATFTITISDENEFAIGPVSDVDGTENTVAENSAGGTVVGITAFAEDADATDTVTYSITDTRFVIDPTTGVVTVADGAVLDAETTSSIDLVVTATSTDGSTSQATFTITISDENEFAIGPVSDVDGTENTVAENSAGGTVVGITAFAEDADATDTVTYSITDTRFVIDPTTGVVTVADGAVLDAETTSSIDLVVTATSTDGSTSQATFTITISDENEFAIGPVSDVDGTANRISASATGGTNTGLTALASDQDVSDTVSYSIDDARFVIDPTTGVVTVADGAVFDANVEPTVTVTVTATSTDGSSSTQSFDIEISEPVGPVSDVDASANTVAENSAGGTVVGLTAFANDPNPGDTVTYSITDARFVIDPNTGVVTVADGAEIDFEATPTIDLEVTATSTDGSSSSAIFTINVSDVNEDISTVVDTDTGVNAVAENGTGGEYVGITAFASDPDAGDTVNYSITDARFMIDPTTGVVTVADGVSFDHEATPTVDLEVTATSSDGSTATETFTVTITDVNEAPDLVVNAEMSGQEFLVNGSFEVFAGTLDGTPGQGWYENPDSIEGWDSYTNVDVHQSGHYNFGATDGSHHLDLSARENGTISQTIEGQLDGHVYELSMDLKSRGAIGESVAEIYWNGELLATIDPAVTGVDWQTFTFNVVGGAGDGTNTLTFVEIGTNNLAGTLIDSVSIQSGSTISVAEEYAGAEIVALSVVDPDDGDSHSFIVSDDRFEVVATGSGYMLKLKDDQAFDYETEQSVTVIVTVTDSGGLSDAETIQIEVRDVNEWAIGPLTDVDASANVVAENSAGGTVVGITAFAEDQDGTDTVTYSITDTRFVIDANTGVITVADGAVLDAEATSSIDIEVTATSSDGSSVTETFTVNITDVNEFAIGPLSDVDASANLIAEGSAGGTVVGITAFAQDPDVSDTVTYSITDTRFIIDANTGVITLADGVDLDFETTASINLLVTATSSDGSTSSRSFTINVGDVNEAPDLVVGDPVGSHNYIVNGSFEQFQSSGQESGYGNSRWYGSAIVNGWSTDADIHSSGWDNNLGTTDGDYRLDLANASNNGYAYQDVQGLADGETYRLSFDLRHRGEVGDAVVRVFWGGVLVAEIAPLATSSDWQSYAFEVTGGAGDGTDRLRFEEVGTDNYKGTQIDSVSLVDVSDITVAENREGEGIVALSVVDPDAGDTHMFTLSDSRFEVVVSDGAYLLKLKDGIALDYESEPSVTVTVTATDSGGLSDTEVIEIRVIDLDDGSPIMGTEEFIHVGDTTALNLADDLTLFEGVDVSVGQILNGDITLTSLLDVNNGLATLGAAAQLLADTGDLAYNALTGVSGALSFDFDRDISSVSFEVSDLYSGLLGIGTERGSWEIYDDGVLVGSGNFSGTGSGMDTINIDTGVLFDQVVLTADASTLGLGSTYTFEQILYTDVDLTVGGNDTLHGSTGDDQIYGLSGQDTIYGHAGDDLIVGGTRDDTLYGGDGSDTFLYQMGDGDDTIHGGAGASWIDMIDLNDGAQALGTYGSDWSVTVTDGSITGVDMVNGEISLSDDAAGYIDLADGSRIDFTEIESIQF